MNRRILLISLLVILSCTVAHAQYTITPLVGAAGSIISSVTAINNDGVAAGYTTDASYYFEPCVWINGEPQIVASGYFTNVATTGINNAGQVVGHASAYFYPTIDEEMGFVYADGSLTPLQNGDYASFWPEAINNPGLVVGELADGAGTYDIATGTMTHFGTFGASVASFTAINNTGLMAGTLSYPYPANMQAFVLCDGHFQSLMGLGGAQTLPNAVNDSCVIVGTADQTGGERAVTWTEHGAVSGPDGEPDWQPILPDVLPVLPGALTSHANDINADGEIVGSMQLAVGQADHAILWSNGQVIDLNTLLPDNSGWVLNDATGINDSGQIVGNGMYDGAPMPFLLTPVPEPATISLVSGFCLMASRRRRGWGRYFSNARSRVSMFGCRYSFAQSAGVP